MNNNNSESIFVISEPVAMDTVLCSCQQSQAYTKETIRYERCTTVVRSGIVGTDAGTTQARRRCLSTAPWLARFIPSRSVAAAAASIPCQQFICLDPDKSGMSFSGYLYWAIIRLRKPPSWLTPQVQLLRCWVVVVVVFVVIIVVVLLSLVLSSLSLETISVIEEVAIAIDTVNR